MARYANSDDLPYGPGNTDYEYDGYVQEILDDEAEAREIEAKRNASGTSPEILSLQDAYIEGQRVGMNGHGREMNTYDHRTPEYHEFERGRMNAIGARLGYRTPRRRAA